MSFELSNSLSSSTIWCFIYFNQLWNLFILISIKKENNYFLVVFMTKYYLIISNQCSTLISVLWNFTLQAGLTSSYYINFIITNYSVCLGHDKLYFSIHWNQFFQFYIVFLGIFKFIQVSLIQSIRIESNKFIAILCNYFIIFRQISSKIFFLSGDKNFILWFIILIYILNQQLLLRHPWLSIP